MKHEQQSRAHLEAEVANRGGEIRVLKDQLRERPAGLTVLSLHEMSKRLNNGEFTHEIAMIEAGEEIERLRTLCNRVLSDHKWALSPDNREALRAAAAPSGEGQNES